MSFVTETKMSRESLLETVIARYGSLLMGINLRKFRKEQFPEIKNAIKTKLSRAKNSETRISKKSIAEQQIYRSKIAELQWWKINLVYTTDLKILLFNVWCLNFEILPLIMAVSLLLARMSRNRSAKHIFSGFTCGRKFSFFFCKIELVDFWEALEKKGSWRNPPVTTCRHTLIETGQNCINT